MEGELMARGFSWEGDRGMLPSQWLEAYPNECSLLFAIRQFFWLEPPTRARAFRGKVGILWLSQARLCLMGVIQADTREEALRRFRRVEAEMQLKGKGAHA